MDRLCIFCIGFLLGVPALFKGAMLAGFTPVKASIILFFAFVAVAVIDSIAEDTSFGFVQAWGVAFFAAAFTAIAAAIAAFIAVVVAIIVTVVYFSFAAEDARDVNVSRLKLFLLFEIEATGIYLALSATSWLIAFASVLVALILVVGLMRVGWSHSRA